MKNSSLNSSTVVITGASSGIGKAAALLFAREGANLVLGARSETLLQEIASQCEAIGANAIAVKTDVTNNDSVKNLFETALSFFDGIDVWINNAGVGAVGEFETTPLEAHEQVIRTNLLGPLYGSYAVVPYFKNRGRGTIINVNSLGAYVGSPFAASYNASKFGLRGLTEALNYELKGFKNINICEISAAFVDTPAPSHAANFTGKEIKPVKPVVEPETMAETMVSLAKNPRPSVHIGVMDRIGRLAHAFFPEITGNIMNSVSRRLLAKARSIEKTEGNLFSPDYEKTFVHGDYS